MKKINCENCKMLYRINEMLQDVNQRTMEILRKRYLLEKEKENKI